VLVSGGGTNLQALLDALHDSAIARIARVISNRPDAGALDRARRSNVPAVVLKQPGDATELLGALHDIQIVVLAGYLKLVPAAVVKQFRGRMINIHPALLPDFGGPRMYGHHVHEAVLASGATESGATVHFVDEVFDRGEIIAQERVPVQRGDTPDTLAARVLEAEHRLLPRVVLQLAREIGDS
jgi:phosphoribosylglycinamide formyltransferase 1